MNRKPISYTIHYSKTADKYLKNHEDIRDDYENSIKELLVGEHPERVDVKRIKASEMIITE